MQLNRALFQNSTFFFSVFIVGALFAFWPRYLSQIGTFKDPHPHVHGFLMALWLLMLFSQAILIRTNRRDLHRLIGKSVYLIGPIAAISIALIGHYSLNRNHDSADRYFTLVLQLGNCLIFAMAIGFAMYFRRDPSTHARFLLCTPLTMTGPIFDRIIAFYIQPHFDVIPRFFDGETLFAQFLTMPVTDLVLVGLVIWDWKSHRRFFAFPIMLAAFLFQQGFAFAFHDAAFWRSFAGWFEALPIT